MKLFKDKDFFKKVLLLSIPIILQNLVTSVLNIFDQIMVGYLPADIADKSLSAVLLANQIVFIYQILIFATANTVNIFIAQYASGGKADLVPRRVMFTLIIVLIVSSLENIVSFFAPQAVIGIFKPNESYYGLASNFLKVVSFSFIPMSITIALTCMMRSMHILKMPLFINIGAVLLNICMNYIFMFGAFGVPAMGLVGAAYGTVVSRIIECVSMLIGMFATKSPLFSNLKDMFHFDKEFTKHFFKMFFPILCNEIFWVLSTTSYLYVYDKLPSSEIVLASMNIAQTMDKLVNVVNIGFGTAVGVVMGNCIGEGDIEKVRDYAEKSIELSVFAGLVVTLLTFISAFIAPPIFKNVSDQAQTMARNLLFLFSATAILRTFSFTFIVGILRSGGDTTFCMLTETLIIWGITVPLVFVSGLVFHLNIYILYLLTATAEILKSIICYRRIKGKKWIKFNCSKPLEEQEQIEYNLKA